MEKQTIQELEIIIKAQVEGARKNIQKFKKETLNYAKDVSKEFNKALLNDNTKKEFDEIEDRISEVQAKIGFLTKQKKISLFQKENLEQYRKELETLNAKMQEIYSSQTTPIYGLDIETSNINKTLNEVQEEANNNPITIPTKIEQSNPTLNNQGTSSNLDKIRKSLKELKREASSLEMKGLNPYEVLSVKDSFRLLSDQVISTIPILSDFRQSLRENLNGEYGDSLLMKFRDIGIKAKETASNIKESFQDKVGVVKDIFNDIGSGVSSRLAPITSMFRNIGSFAKATFNKIKTNIQQSADTTGTPLNKLKNLITRIKNIGSASDKAKKSFNSFGNSIGKSLKSGIKSIKKFALSLLSVRSAFSLVSKASQAYLSFDTQLNDSIQNSWNVLGSLLAPILEYVASLFNKLVSSVAAFIKSLTGIDLVAKANAKALNKQAKSAQSASKSLAGIDDIDVLSTSSGTSDEATTITVDDIDISPLEKFASKIKKIFDKLFDPFKQAWENVGTDVFDSMKSMISNLGELCSSVFTSFVDAWSNGTGEEIISNFLLIFGQVFDIIGGISEALTNAWNNAGTGTSIIQSIADIFKKIQEFGLSIGDSIKKWVVSESFQEALNKVFGFIDDIFGYVKDICDWLLDMYNTYLKPVIDDKLLPAIDSIIIAIMDVWNAVKPVVDLCIDCIKTMLEPVIEGLCDFIGGIIDVIKGIADFISGVFTGDWKKAWEGIKTIFKGLWDSMASLIKTPINMMLTGVEWLVNKIISGFNSFKKALNKISFDIPDWIPIIGGKKWGFNLKMSDEVTLPRLAKGDVAYEPIVAQIGEYANARNNPEIVSPKSIMEDTFRNVLSEFEFGGTRIETLKIDVAGENFYQGAVDYINSENTRKGINIIKEMA